MSLKFFIDRRVSSSISTILWQSGYNVLLLKDYIPTESPDGQVIATAQTLEAILVSLNRDFANIVTYAPTNYRGIISLQ